MMRSSRGLKTYHATISGEFYVSARLAQLGWSVFLPIKNSPDFDLIISRNQQRLRIQVKTAWAKSGSPTWIMHQRHELIKDADLFYVFVLLPNAPLFPKFWVVPSHIVANFLKRDHHEWLERLGKHGKRHKDSSMRKFKPDGFDEYEEGWHVLQS